MKILFRQSPYQMDDDVLEIKKMSIREELLQVKHALEIAYSGFDNVTDPDLIDCYIYEVNSILKRYKYLLEQAAKDNILPSETFDETYQMLTITN
ncbi:MAG: DUF2508 family protein [Lachnospiraceae bacterium]|nr:DUF2508 family protein [Lachnospiraceae bacterium]